MFPVTCFLVGRCNTVHMNARWAKGGVVLQGARESVFTTKADHSFFTEPVSCLVFNAVGKTNVSILVDVHCESRHYRLNMIGAESLGGNIICVCVSEIAPYL